MSHVFISYSSSDSERVKRIAEAMQAKGYRVWWDRQIAPGQTFDAVIEKALDEAQCVIVLWSSTSVDSDWVKTEAAEAARRKILVPALLDEVKIPLEFRRLQAADLTRWDGRLDDSEFEKFLRAIDMGIQKAAMPQTAPQTVRSVGRSSGAAAVMAPATDSHTYSDAARKHALEAPQTKSAFPGRQLPERSAPQTPGRSLGKWAIAAFAVVLASLVSIYLLRGPTSVQIPNVVGMPYDAGAAALAAAQLVPERQERLSDADAPGVILSQTPAAGTLQARTAKVVLTVAVPPVKPTPDKPATSLPGKPQPAKLAVESSIAGATKTGLRGDVSKNADAVDSRTIAPRDSERVQTAIKEASDFPKVDPAAEAELQQRLDILKLRGDSLSDFFGRRRTTVEHSGGHLRPEIETSIKEVSLEVGSATRLLQGHQVSEASRHVDLLEKAVQQLEALK